MEGDRRFARASGEGEENPIFVFGDGLQGVVDGDLLIVARRLRAADVFKGDGVEAFFPFVGGEGLLPEFFGRGKIFDETFRACEHVDLINFFAVGGVGEGELKFLSVVFRLSDSLADFVLVALGFDDGELATFVNEDVIGDKRFAARAARLNFARRDVTLAQDA